MKVMTRKRPPLLLVGVLVALAVPAAASASVQVGTACTLHSYNPIVQNGLMGSNGYVSCTNQHPFQSLYIDSYLAVKATGVKVAGSFISHQWNNPGLLDEYAYAIGYGVVVTRGVAYETCSGLRYVNYLGVLYFNRVPYCNGTTYGP